MHLPLVLPTLFLTVLSQSCHAVGRPATSPGFLSVPISRRPSLNHGSTLPPAIIHQQHVNRGIRRLEHMKGRDKTPDCDLLSKIQKRASVLSPSLMKRYYHARPQDMPSHHSNPEGNHHDHFNTLQTSPGTDLASGDVTKANPPTFPNSVGLDIQADDVGYIGTVQIGTPPRDFRLVMDSGSADFWVGAEGCKGPHGGCGNHAFLGPKSSSTFNDTNRPWSIEYGTGAASGHIVTDDVTIAGLRLNFFEFGIAFNETEDFTPDNIPFDGLVGLARSIMSQQRTTTLVEALHKAHLIDAPITSYKIPRLADGKNDGEMTLGAMDPTKFDSKSVVTVPNADSRGFWAAGIDGMKVNGKDMGWTNRRAIFDTGTTLIIAPKDDVKKIHEEIPGAQFDGVAWTVPCTTTASLSLVFGGREFSVRPSDLVFLPADFNDPKGECMTGITSGDINSSTEWLVGDVFLKNVYLSTNAKTNKISLAKLAD